MTRRCCVPIRNRSGGRQWRECSLSSGQGGKSPWAFTCICIIFSLLSLEAVVALKVCIACLLCLKTVCEVNIWTPGGPGEKRAGVCPQGLLESWSRLQNLSQPLALLFSFCFSLSRKTQFACLIMCGSRGGSAPGS